MKDLKIYYEMEDGRIDADFDKEIEEIAKKHGMNFQGSGYYIYTGKRDLHFRKDKKKRTR